ncbi:hypothetical protein P3G55_20055 [Leptospira sp. 96542]|nr:hypothetical protein [Leptospira sp. 96542]
MPSPDDFSQFSETFSISKIDIDGKSKIGISNILLQPYFFRSKVPAQNPVTLAFVMADNLEYALNDGLPKFLDPSIGYYLTDPISDFVNELPALDQVDDYPIRVAYRDIPEFDDHGVSNYLTHSAKKLLLNENIIRRFLLQAGVIESPVINYFRNTNNKKYLYIIPYVPRIQRTELAMSGRISFTLEF